MHEVEKFALAQACKEWAPQICPHVVPTHVGDFQVRSVEAYHGAGKNAQTIRLSLVGLFEEELHPQANTEERDLNRAEPFEKSAPVEGLHRHACLANARKNQPASALEFFDRV
jgi:hypothetical protein